MDKDRLHYQPPAEQRNADKVTADWKQQAKETIEQINERIRKVVELDKPAKNVILMMGDGLGIPTHTAARFYMSQTREMDLNDVKLGWENMPHTAFSKTYATDYQTPDSGATATALLCGEKTGNSIIACSQEAVYDNCESMAGTELPSIVHHAMDAGKWTGIVTTTRLTHASPACAYAHAVNRDWEADIDLPPEALGVCPDIASQFIDDDKNNNIKVFLGGGRENFLPNSTRDPEYRRQNGVRMDDRDLTQEWLDEKEERGLTPEQYAYVYEQEGFDEVDPQSTEYLFGLFEPSHMLFELDRTNGTFNGMGEPSLSEMVEKSIQILNKSQDGYFLFVEGGRIDHGHHSNNPQRALGDALAFSDAVEMALNLTNEEDTLIIVTADHSHAFAFSGDSKMGTNIFQYDQELQIADDEKPFAILSYSNGPGFLTHRTNISDRSEQPRRNQSEIKDQMLRKNYIFDASVPLDLETHGGDDVAIHARGPMAHLVMGTQEQSYIGNLMMYAMCLGDNTELCDNPPPPLGCE